VKDEINSVINQVFNFLCEVFFLELAT